MNRVEKFVQDFRETIDGKNSVDSLGRLFVTAGASGIALFVLWNNIDVQPWYLKNVARLIELSPLELIGLYHLKNGLVRSQAEELIEVREQEERKTQALNQRGKERWV